MNSSYSSNGVVMKRFRLWKRQYLHVVIYTSLFWIFVDVFFIMLFSDCTKQVIVPCESIDKHGPPMIEELGKSIENERLKHPKFQVHDNLGRNSTILNRKKFEKSKKKPGGFMEQWFGSNSGTEN